MTRATDPGRRNHVTAKSSSASLSTKDDLNFWRQPTTKFLTSFRLVKFPYMIINCPTAREKCAISLSPTPPPVRRGTVRGHRRLGAWGVRALQGCRGVLPLGLARPRQGLQEGLDASSSGCAAHRRFHILPSPPPEARGSSRRWSLSRRRRDGGVVQHVRCYLGGGPGCYHHRRGTKVQAHPPRR